MKNMKKRIIATMIAAISAFSVMGIASQSAFAAEEQSYMYEYFDSYEEQMEFFEWHIQDRYNNTVNMWCWLKEDPAHREWSELFPQSSYFIYEWLEGVKAEAKVTLYDWELSADYLDGAEAYASYVPEGVMTPFFDSVFCWYASDRYVSGMNYYTFRDYLDKNASWIFA